MKKKKKTKSDKPTGLQLTLEGKVFVEETVKGKVVDRTEIEGDVVLRCLLLVIEQALDRLEPTKETPDVV